MSRIVIAQASLLSLPAVNRLFTYAVVSNFNYFPESVQQKVIKDHAVPKLALASLHPRRIILVARAAGKIIGYAIGSVPKVGDAQLYWLYVSPEHRGSNIGLKLLSRMLKLQAKKGAKVISIATHDHRRYYERQGFKFVRRTVTEGVPMDILTFTVKA